MRPVRPAAEVLICHGDHVVTLRASLRAACALADMPGGFGHLVDQISRQSLTAIKTTIRATATDRAAAERLLAGLEGKPLGPFARRAQADCLDLLMVILAPAQDKAQGPRDGHDRAVPLSHYLSDLFRYATGWLGWPPSVAWDASPDEIATAFDAHVDRLVRMTPGATGTPDRAAPADTYTPERLRQIEAQDHDPAFDRAGLHALKAKHT